MRLDVTNPTLARQRLWPTGCEPCCSDSCSLIVQRLRKIRTVAAGFALDPRCPLHVDCAARVPVAQHPDLPDNPEPEQNRSAERAKRQERRDNLCQVAQRGPLRPVTGASWARPASVRPPKPHDEHEWCWHRVPQYLTDPNVRLALPAPPQEQPNRCEDHQSNNPGHRSARLEAEERECEDLGWSVGSFLIRSRPPV